MAGKYCLPGLRVFVLTAHRHSPHISPLSPTYQSKASSLSLLVSSSSLLFFPHAPSHTHPNLSYSSGSRSITSVCKDFSLSATILLKDFWRQYGVKMLWRLWWPSAKNGLLTHSSIYSTQVYWSDDLQCHGLPERPESSLTSSMIWVTGCRKGPNALLPCNGIKRETEIFF